MKKKFLVIALISAMALSMTACSNEETYTKSEVDEKIEEAISEATYTKSEIDEMISDAVSSAEATETTAPEAEEEKTTEESTQSEAAETATSAADEENTGMVDTINFTTDSGNISYVGFEKTNDGLLYDQSGYIFIFDFTNSLSQPSEVQDAYEIQFFQNGVELSNAGSWSSEGGEQYDLMSAYFNEVLQGGTSTFGYTAVTDDDSDITLMVTYNGTDTSQMMVVDVNSDGSVSAQ